VATYSRRRDDDESGEPVEGAEGAGADLDPRDDIDPLDLPEEEQLVYDLSGWPTGVHAEVVEALADAGIGHAWLGTDLVIHERHEDRADLLLSDIERRHGLESDEDSDEDGEVGGPREPSSEIEYDLADWAAPARALLTAQLIEADIAFRWEGGLLVTAADAEERVDEVLDGVEDTIATEGLPESEGEADESPFSSLFVAVDDLASHPNDRDAILRLNELFERTEPGPVPFGVHPAAWERILDQVSDLLDLSLESDDAGDVRAEAIEIREVLRPLV
jgi:hypothetical protein